MTIEHIAWQVEHPGEMTEWFCRHLGFTLKRGSDEPFPVRFLADSGGRVMIELYNNPSLTSPDYASTDPLLMHLALTCEDMTEKIDLLLEAGATIAQQATTTDAGDLLAMLRDPWGFPIQLCQRKIPMV
ncbi:VOC family protein [Haloferula chungangensis]|uniref:VOC family protein n=1 Tax=Haloferula chungangensis TaxID=1048331 RepID=A0ABW2LB85_9BACT